MAKTRIPSLTNLNRRRWTAEDAKQALRAWKQSGLQMRAFAAREGLDPQRLWRWRRQIGTPEEMAFEEIVRRDVAPPRAGEEVVPAAGEPFEIVLGSGRRVRVPASFDATALRQLLTIVDEVRSC